MRIVHMANRALNPDRLQVNQFRCHMENPSIRTFMTFLDEYVPFWDQRVFEDNKQVHLLALSTIVRFLDKITDGSDLRYGKSGDFLFMSLGDIRPGISKQEWMDEAVRIARCEVTKIVSQYDLDNAPLEKYINLFRDNPAFSPEMMEEWLDGSVGT